MTEQPQQHGVEPETVSLEEVLEEHGYTAEELRQHPAYVPDKEAMEVNLQEGILDDSTTANLRYGQQHGVDEVVNRSLDAFRRRFVRNPEVSELTPFGFFEAGWSESGQEIERLQAQVEQLTEERQREREVGTLEHARQHVSCGVVIAAKESEIARLRARCASLEAVAEAAKGIALRQSPAHQALRQALAALDQHAITTREGNHG